MSQARKCSRTLAAVSIQPMYHATEAAILSRKGISGRQPRQGAVERESLHFAIDTYGEDWVEDAWDTFSEGAEDLDFDGPEAQMFWPWAHYDWRPEAVYEPAGSAPRSTPMDPVLAEAFLEKHG